MEWADGVVKSGPNSAHFGTNGSDQWLNGLAQSHCRHPGDLGGGRQSATLAPWTRVGRLSDPGDGLHARSHLVNARSGPHPRSLALGPAARLRAGRRRCSRGPTPARYRLARSRSAGPQALLIQRRSPNHPQSRTARVPNTGLTQILFDQCGVDRESRFCALGRGDDHPLDVARAHRPRRRGRQVGRLVLAG